MTSLLTMNEIADLIATAENRPDRVRIGQQVRGLHQRGLIKASDTGGPKGAWRFTLLEACAARLLLVAVDNGLAGEEVNQFNGPMRFQARRVVPTGGHYTLALENVVEQIIEDVATPPENGPRNWVFEVVRSRDLETGSLQVSGSWTRHDAGRPVNRFDRPDPMALNTGVLSATLESCLQIRVTPLLAPLVASFVVG